MKSFFIQTDIAVLETFKTKLDEELMGKGWDFFTRSTTLYKLRLQKADSMVQALLSGPLDFTKPDNIEWPCTSFAQTPAELARRWQKFLKWRVLENIADKLTDGGKNITEMLPADFVKLESAAREKTKAHERVYINSILQTSQRFADEMEDDYLNAIAWCYDPHTNYMNTKEKMNSSLQ